MKNWLFGFCLSFAVCANAQNQAARQAAREAAATARQIEAERAANNRLAERQYENGLAQQAQQRQEAQRQIQQRIDSLKKDVERKQSEADSAKKYADELPQRLLGVGTTLTQNNGDDFRIVDGILYNIKDSAKWEDVAYGHDFDEYFKILVVRKILKDGMLECDQEFYDRAREGGIFLSSTDPIILKNYPGESYVGMKISKCRAIRLLNKPGDTINTYDYGLPNTPENRKTHGITAQQLKEFGDQQITNALENAASKQADLDASKKALQDFLDAIEAAKQKAKADADAKKNAAQATVLKSNQEDADKGDAYGLLRMGERYRDGDGVEKDLAKAKDYLTKSAAAGSLTAAEELSKLNPVSTNSPATQ